MTMKEGRGYKPSFETYERQEDMMVVTTLSLEIRKGALRCRLGLDLDNDGVRGLMAI